MIEIPNDIDSLKALVIQLLGKIEQLEVKNAALRQENAELRHRLGLDSHNSHKPPGSDGLKKKPVKSALPKEKGQKGGQLGHRGKTLERVSEVDQIVVHLPGHCSCCGREIGLEDEYEVVESRQVFDLPEPKLEVTEHRVGQIHCCGVAQPGEFPLEVSATVQYGAGVRAWVVLLSVSYRLPLEQITQLAVELYGYEINSSTILEMQKGCYERLEATEAEIKEHLKEQAVVHFDETGIRAQGKLHWLHTASTEHYTHLFVNEKRGQQALLSDDSVIKEFRGIAVHDCWASYFLFLSCAHALCGAHLLRELVGLAECGSQWALLMKAYLLELLHTDRPVANPEVWLERYRAILAQGHLEEPLPQPGKRGRPKRSIGRCLLDRLRTHESEVLAFALKAGVPFTNNQAERDIRCAKVKLKVCGGFRTLAGARFYARIQAVVSTLRKQQADVFPQLRGLFLSKPISLA